MEIRAGQCQCNAVTVSSVVQASVRLETVVPKVDPVSRNALILARRRVLLRVDFVAIVMHVQEVCEHVDGRGKVLRACRRASRFAVDERLLLWQIAGLLRH